MSERNEDSCRTILHFLADCQGDNADAAGKRNAMLKDLCWRATQLGARERSLILSRACYMLLPADIRACFTPESLDVVTGLAESPAAKQHKDVAIMTVIRPELCGVLRALGRPHDAPEDDRAGPFGYWFADLRCVSGRVLSVVVTMVGRPRNVPCAVAVSQLLSRFDVGLLMLVGIAAGVRAKTRLGDVVYAERVYDYEHKRLEVSQNPSWLKRWWPRFLSRTSNPTPPTSSESSAGASGPADLSGLELVERGRPEIWGVPDVVCEALERTDWKPVKGHYARLIAGVDDLPSGADTFVPSIHDGSIAAGEKLIADGSLERMYQSFDQRIRAGDQEDSGFAQAAEFHKVLWCIFRGVCDFADPHKAGKWQASAAIAAAATGITFLESVWAGTSEKLAPARAAKSRP